MVGDLSPRACRELDALAQVRGPMQAEAILIAHQRRDVGSCLCGWAELGKSHAGHQASKLREAGLLTQVAVDSPPQTAPATIRGNSMDFGQALAALKDGGKVARDGWNGKGMFVVHQKGYPDGIAINKNTAEATGIPQGTVCAFRPYLMMRTIDGEFVPWVASQSDLLADDWAVA